MNIVLALIAGLAVGVVLGALGGGGAIITVPLLIYALGMTPLEGTTGSLVIVGLSSLVAASSHARAGHVAWGQGLIFALLGTAGTVAGSLLSRGLDPTVLLTAFGLLLLVVATLMFRRSGARETAQRPPRSLKDPRVLGATAVTATGVGLLTGVFGVGGGFAIVPALTLVLGFSMPLAVGTSLLVIGLNSATALVAKLGTGVSLDWPVVAAFTATAIVGSLGGSRISRAASPRVLQRSFAGLLVLVAVYTLASSLTTLLG